MGRVPTLTNRQRKAKEESEKVKQIFVNYERGRGFPSNWQEIKKEIIERDNYRCVVCGKRSFKLQIHHLKHRKEGGGHESTNLVSLCGKCHMLESYLPDFAINKAFKIPLSEIPSLKEKVRSKLKVIEASLKAGP